MDTPEGASFPGDRGSTHHWDVQGSLTPEVLRPWSAGEIGMILESAPGRFASSSLGGKRFLLLIRPCSPARASRYLTLSSTNSNCNLYLNKAVPSAEQMPGAWYPGPPGRGQNRPGGCRGLLPSLVCSRTCYS